MSSETENSQQLKYSGVTRSNRFDVRNPILGLPGISAIQNLPPESRIVLVSLLLDLRRTALSNAEKCWRRHKAPMAVYWKAVAVYSGHIARALRSQKTGEKQ